MNNAFDLISIRDKDNKTLLSYAASQGRFNCFEVLLNHARDYSTRHLRDTVSWDNIAKWVNTPESGGYTCLFFAVGQGNYKMYHNLIKVYKADPFVKSDIGETLLHCAAEYD